MNSNFAKGNSVVPSNQAASLPSRVRDLHDHRNFGAWRHLYICHTLYWGLVFPLAMHTVCRFPFAMALGLDFRILIHRYFIHLAIVYGFFIFIGLVARATWRPFKRAA